MVGAVCSSLTDLENCSCCKVVCQLESHHNDVFTSDSSVKCYQTIERSKSTTIAIVKCLPQDQLQAWWCEFKVD